MQSLYRKELLKFKLPGRPNAREHGWQEMLHLVGCLSSLLVAPSHWNATARAVPVAPSHTWAFRHRKVQGHHQVWLCRARQFFVQYNEVWVFTPNCPRTCSVVTYKGQRRVQSQGVTCKDLVFIANNYYHTVHITWNWIYLPGSIALPANPCTLITNPKPISARLHVHEQASPASLCLRHKHSSIASTGGASLGSDLGYAALLRHGQSDKQWAPGLVSKPSQSAPQIKYSLYLVGEF